MDSSPTSSATRFSESHSMLRIRAESSLALQTAALNTVQRSEINKNANTLKAYSGKQKEYIDWCKGVGYIGARKEDIERAKSLYAGYFFPDRDNVSAEKLNLFLQHRVVNRKKKQPGKKRNREVEETDKLSL